MQLLRQSSLHDGNLPPLRLPTSPNYPTQEATDGWASNTENNLLHIASSHIYVISLFFILSSYHISGFKFEVEIILERSFNF